MSQKKVISMGLNALPEIITPILKNTGRLNGSAYHRQVKRRFTMIIENPVRETYKEIRAKYDGYCVLVIKCENKKQDFGSGIALAFDKSLPDLTRETIDILDDTMGIIAYKTFTDIGNHGYGPIQVIHHV
jgi:hypothetical protein